MSLKFSNLYLLVLRTKKVVHIFVVTWDRHNYLMFDPLLLLIVIIIILGNSDLNQRHPCLVSW